MVHCPGLEVAPSFIRCTLHVPLSLLNASLDVIFGYLCWISAPFEHIMPHSSIIIDEEEPTSIVAYTLASRHYTDELGKMKQPRSTADPPPPPTSSTGITPSSSTATVGPL